jgi:hypothetical protein
VEARLLEGAPCSSFYSVHRPLTLRGDSSLSELRNIQQFYTLWPQNSFSPRQYPSELGTQVAIPIYNIGGSDSSKLYRLAILVLMNYLEGDSSHRQDLEYLNQFYQEAQRCLDRNSVLELIHASYVIGAYSLIGGASPKMATDNCRQFCSSLTALSSCTVDKQKLLWFEMLWQRILTSLYYIHRDNWVFGIFGEPIRMMESLEPLQQLLQVSISLLPSNEDISNFRLSMTSDICQKIYSLSIYMQFYLDRFLYQVTFRADARDVRVVHSRLEDILGRIVHLIPLLSSIREYVHNAYPTLPMECWGSTNDFLGFDNFRPRGLGQQLKERDTALALLYVFARILENALAPTANSEGKVAETNLYALALCRISASFPKDTSNPFMVSMLVKRSLFWAGMILKKSEFPGGSAYRVTLTSSLRMDSGENTTMQ